jgi:hypothetical protein
MTSFTIFQDSPAFPASSLVASRRYPSLSSNNGSHASNYDKENVDPMACLRTAMITSRTGKKQKRIFVREDNFSSLTVNRKAKVTITGDRTKSMKNSEKKRRILGGVAPAPLSRTDSTILLNELLDVADRRVIELTVSPLADASEAYLSMPGLPLMCTSNLKPELHVCIEVCV